MITLSHVEGTPFYQDETITTEPGLLAYYVSGEGISPSTLPPTLNVSECWNATAELKGYFLFLKERPDWSVFGPTFQQGSGLPPDPAHTGFAWVVYSNETEELGAINSISVEQELERAVIAADVTFSFNNYGLPFKQGGLIKIIEDSGHGIYWFTFEYPPGEDWPTPSGAGINLPLIGVRRYSLSSLGLIGDFSDDPEHGWDVACRYYGKKEDQQVVAQRYPVFRLPPEGFQILFEMNWDPVDQLNPERTYLLFRGANYQITLGEAVDESSIEPLPGEGILPSWFRTIYGESISLRPIVGSANPAKLVFEKRPAQGRTGDLFYLVPAGEFELVADPQAAASEPKDAQDDPPFDLLCGLGGTESIGFYSRVDLVGGDIMTFHPKQAAFAPVFPVLTKGSQTNGSSRRRMALADAPLLNKNWTTSWVSVTPNTAAPERMPVYFSQPEEAALFKEKAAGSQEDDGDFVLENYSAPAAYLDASASSVCYPMVAYSGVAPAEGSDAFSPQDIRDFELQIINPTRRNEISGISAGPPPGLLASQTPVTTTTPQGLIAVVQGLEWKSVLLAKNEEDGSRLEFIDLPKSLRDALQTNQLFLVASLKEPLGNFSNHITIAGWPFYINVGQAEGDLNFRNILIFKFGAGTVKERVADPKSWTEAKAFNENPQALASWLQAYIEDAVTASEENERLRNFVNIVNSPAWNGILALRVTVGLEQFPDDLKGLLGGIDLSRFYAHHFGIEINFITAEGGLQQSKSSLFALINYVDKDYLTKQAVQSYHGDVRGISHVDTSIEGVVKADQELFDFKVLTLQVVFANSDIKDFVSKIQLTTTQWFGEPARLAPGFPPNPLGEYTIEFDGSYENHDGHRTYSFTTVKDQSYKFLLTSQVINYVEVVKGQFNTLRSEIETGAQDSSMRVFTRFSFWGFINFKELEGLDIFSFGDLKGETNTNRKGLYFANLGILMNFALIGETTTDRVFIFDPAAVNFDISLSTIRPDSLFSRFPIDNPVLNQGRADETTADLGFLPMRTPPEFKTKPLDKQWFGLVFDLNWGTMGALAEKAGFTANILSAWSPSPQELRASIQLKLPGSGGGKKTLSLQSVLKLSAQYFEMSAEVDPSTQERGYKLFFKNIGLSLLGQKLPPSGNTDIVLFGHTGGSGATKSLAWFAAYYKDTPPLLLED